MADDETEVIPDGELPDDYVEPEAEPEGDTEETPEGDEPETEEAEDPAPGSLEFKRIEDAQRAFHQTRGENADLKRRLEALEGREKPEPEPDPVEETQRRIDALLQPRANEYYREYVDQGFDTDEASMKAWRKARSEGTMIQQMAELIADQKYGHLVPAFEEMQAPKIVQQAARMAMEAEPTELVTEEELTAGIMEHFPDFSKLAAAQRPGAALWARRMVIGEKAEKGLLGGVATATKPPPANPPNTGPGGNRNNGKGQVNPVRAKQISDYKERWGNAAAGLTDRDILAAIERKD